MFGDSQFRLGFGHLPFGSAAKGELNPRTKSTFWGAFDSAKNHKRQRRKRQS